MSTADHLLLDTHSLIWLATDDVRLSRHARSLVTDLRNDLSLSVASVWELAIKKSLGKIELRSSLAAFLQTQMDAIGFRILDIRSEHAVLVDSMPFHHRDPFDRLLVAQASHEGMKLLSADPVFDAYAVERVW